MRGVLFRAPAVLMLLTAGIAAEEHKAPLDKLEQLMKDYSVAMRSGDKAKQLEMLKKVRPTKEDLATLKAERADDLLAAIERSLAYFEKNLAEIAAEEARGGEFKSAIAAEDERVNSKKERGPFGVDMKFYKVLTKYENGGGGRSGFLYVNGRWLWLNFWISPEEAEKLQPKK